LSYTVYILPSALRELKVLPHHIQRQIDARIQGLAENPRPPGVKALKGKHKGLYRIRSGDYRIVYGVRDVELLVTVVRVADRKDSYD
jgi:mRNA interferase RelE/StbE